MATTLSQRVRHIVGNAFGAAIVEETIEKALQNVKERAARPESVFYDPMSLFMGQEWLSRGQVQASYSDLRSMAKNPIIASIIQTRLNQVAAFCRPRQKDYDLGFEIQSDDPSANQDDEMSQELTNWINSMGMVNYGEPRLETFARKFLYDSLTLDQACAEVISLRNGQPAYTVVIDAATIRRLKASLEFGGLPSDKPWYVQVIEDQIVTSYTQDDLIFAIRNPRTDIKALGYGAPELETLIRTITALINAEKYNSGQVAQGGTSKGILIVKGDADRDQFTAFKREFREAIRNAGSYWRPPVLRVGKDADVSWEQLDRSNRDMEYAALFDFLVKEACGVFQMDPTEINWSIGPSTAQVVYNSNTQVQNLSSKERGLKPLLAFFANVINTNLLNKIDPRYRLEFVGFDTDRKSDVELIGKEVSTFKTVNEVRADRNMPPIPGGDMILSQIYLEALTNLGGTEPIPGGDPSQDPGDDSDSIDLSQELSNAD